MHCCWRDSVILVSPCQFLPEVPLLRAGSTLFSGSRAVLWGEKASFLLWVTVPSRFFSPVVQVVFRQGESREHPHTPSPLGVL